MASFNHLEGLTGEIAAAAEVLSTYCGNVNAYPDPVPPTVPQSVVPTDAPSEAHQARRSIIANAANLQTLLSEPADFIQRLAIQVGNSLA
jgi:hypothetical protein